MRIFTVTAAVAGLVLSVAVAYAHEPPEWVSDVKDDGGPPAWVDEVKTDGGPPAFVDDPSGAIDGDAETADDVATDEDASRGAMGEENANVPEWVADVKADGGPPVWVEDVKADGGPPVWVEDVRRTPAAAEATTQTTPKRAGR